MKNLKKFVRAFLIACLLIATTCAFSYCNKTQLKNEANEAKVITGEVATLTALNETEKADIVSVDKAVLTKEAGSTVKNIIEKGTILVINNVSDEEVSQIAQELDLSFNVKDKNWMQETYGAVIRKELSGEYNISEVIAEIAKKEVLGKIKEPSQQDVIRTLTWIRENEKIDMVDMFKTLKEEDAQRLNMSQNLKSAGMGASTLLGSDFYHDRMILSLYTSATEEDFTSYDVPSYRLAGIDVLLTGLKLKTVGTTTYDAFAADFIVGGDTSNGCKIVKYHGKLGTPASSRYSIFGEMLESNSSQSITVSLSAKPWQISGGLQYQYSYTTGGQNVVNHLNDNAYSKWWEVTPNNPSAGGSYRISPNLLVELKDGTTTKGTIKATFSYIKVNNGFASNRVSDVDKVLSFSYKNHAKVS